MNAFIKVANNVARIHQFVRLNKKGRTEPVSIALVEDLKKMDLDYVDPTGSEQFCRKIGEEVFIGLLAQPRKDVYVGMRGTHYTLTDIGRLLLTA